MFALQQRFFEETQICTRQRFYEIVRSVNVKTTIDRCRPCWGWRGCWPGQRCTFKRDGLSWQCLEVKHIKRRSWTVTVSVSRSRFNNQLRTVFVNC